jgi:hypothetical protein
MRLGRVPFFLSSSQVWARAFRPFPFAAQLKRLARVPDCVRTNRGTPAVSRLWQHIYLQKILVQLPVHML